MGFECFWLRLCLKLQRVWSPAQPEQYQNMSHIFCGLATNTLKLSTRERIPQYVHTGIYSSMFQIAYRPVTSDSANVSLRQHLPWTAALLNSDWMNFPVQRTLCERFKQLQRDLCRYSTCLGCILSVSFYKKKNATKSLLTNIVCEPPYWCVTCPPCVSIRRFVLQCLANALLLEQAQQSIQPIQLIRVVTASPTNLSTILCSQR
jgi:hypothetical protein